HRLRRNAECGNGVLEDNEECDCGPDCSDHRCCDQTCRLKEHAQCSDGLCCSDCQLRHKGFMCRPALGECDLPEYCDGTSGECPIDRYKQDGTLCDRIHYCFGGRCKNPDNQCVDIYGSPARSAPEHCYISMNTKGDRFGNCGLWASSRTKYVNCSDDHIFCGKLICTNIRRIPAIKPHHTLIQVPHKDDWCWSTDAYNMTDIPDDGEVHNGTLCAPHKVCMNYSCTDHAVLHYDCEPNEMCNGRGVCNNLRHCHCEAGYAPPDCKAAGNGGSVDSGPPGKPHDGNPSEDESRSHSVSRSNSGRGCENEDESKGLSRMVYLFALFLLIVFLSLIVGAIIGAGKERSQCQQKVLEDTQETVPETEVGRLEEEPGGKMSSDRKKASIANT
ncbi:disintegrin and metalloproteinase domain-containing protein 1a-like, partial [Puma concolor]|uniref:Disintegrin and metalloproteinase domain-containing protein 1a-like n=1 Tax=Puma concolor TaxID=9696 RepID=A0A6P6IMV5_PUMCO